MRHLELDRQRAVRARVLADEAIRLQPSGERGFSDLYAIELSELLEGRCVASGADRDAGRVSHLRAVRVQVHTHPELELIHPQPRGLGAALVHRLDDVVGRRFDEAPVAKPDAEHALTSVRLRREIRVIPLAS